MSCNTYFTTICDYNDYPVFLKKKESEDRAKRQQKDNSKSERLSANIIVSERSNYQFLKHSQLNTRETIVESRETFRVSYLTARTFACIATDESFEAPRVNNKFVN